MRSEHEEQKALVRWARLQSGATPALHRLFAIPNGGDRNVIVAAKLKAEGVKKGVSDLFLAHPVPPFHGLWIEMKAKKGRLREDQRCWLLDMTDAGYATAVCHGFDPAIHAINEYLGGTMRRGLEVYK